MLSGDHHQRADGGGREADAESQAQVDSPILEAAAAHSPTGSQVSAVGVGTGIHAVN